MVIIFLNLFTLFFFVFTIYFYSFNYFSFYRKINFPILTKKMYDSVVLFLTL